MSASPALATLTTSEPKGIRLSTTDSELRRVSIQSDITTVDLALPAAIPVAALTPSIVDLLQPTDARAGLTAKRYHLSLPGLSALDPAKTLRQNGVRDGAVLFLSHEETPPPAPRHHDVAEAVLAAREATAHHLIDSRRRTATRLAGALSACLLTGIGGLAMIRNAFSVNPNGEVSTILSAITLAALAALLFAAVARRVYRDALAALALSGICTTLAAVAGFVAVPGAPGVCQVLLAATSAAVTSVLTMRASGCGVVASTAVCCVALVVAVAALVGVLTAAPLQAVGAASVLASLGLLSVAARVSIVLAGLSPGPAHDASDVGELGLPERVTRADRWLSSLLGGFSSAAAVGAVVTVLAGAPRPSCLAFGSVTGALLLLRSRSNDDRRMLAFVIGGIGVVGTTFAVAALRAPLHVLWIAAVTTILTTAAMYLGFAAPVITLTPFARRCADSLEWLALAAMVPLTLWICGLYAAVRGLNLT